MGGIGTRPSQPGMIGYTPPNAIPGYKEPVTGAGGDYPTLGVDASQQYDAAARLKSQKEAEDAAAALSKQNFDQSMQGQERTLGMIPGIFSSVSGGGSSGSVSYPGGVSPQAAQAAAEAEFARAKDKSGQIAKSALTGLSDYSAASGRMGSGMQGEEAAKIINGQAGGLADLNREQAIQALNYAQHANDISYQGDITQRGQDLSNRTSMAQSLIGLLRSGGVAY